MPCHRDPAASNGVSLVIARRALCAEDVLSPVKYWNLNNLRIAFAWLFWAQAALSYAWSKDRFDQA